MSKLPLARAPKTVELEAPCAPEQLHTTIEEHGFSKTVSSNSGDPRGLPTKLHWRTPTDDTGELTVRGLLGQGGMSSVLLVDQPALNREVAVKVPRTSEGAQLLVTEARLNGLVEHPGVIPVYALVTDDQNQPALVMRKVDATSWRALLEAPAHPLWKQLGGDPLEAQVPSSSRSATPSRTHTPGAWCTATSSPRTCSSAPSVRSSSPTGAWPRG